MCLFDSLPEEIIQLIVLKVNEQSCCSNDLFWTIMSLSKMSSYLKSVMRKLIVLVRYDVEFGFGLTYCNYKGYAVGSSIEIKDDDIELTNRSMDGTLLPNSYFIDCDYPNYLIYCDGVVYRRDCHDDVNIPEYKETRKILDQMINSDIRIATEFSKQKRGETSTFKPIVSFGSSCLTSQFDAFSDRCRFTSFKEHQELYYSKVNGRIGAYDYFRVYDGGCDC